MKRRSLSHNWTEEDRRTYAKWTRLMAVFYGCIALLVLGIFLLSQPWGVVPNEARDGETKSVGLQGKGTNHNADGWGKLR
jgi:hypothetical protein